MAHEQPAEPVIVALLFERPDPALGLVELSDQPQASLVGVVAHPFAQKGLVEVEALDTVVLPLRKFLQQTGHQVPRLARLLDETQNLVYFVGHNVPVLVLVQPPSRNCPLRPVGIVLPVVL